MRFLLLFAVVSLCVASEICTLCRCRNGKIVRRRISLFSAVHYEVQRHRTYGFILHADFRNNRGSYPGLFVISQTFPSLAVLDLRQNKQLDCSALYKEVESINQTWVIYTDCQPPHTTMSIPQNTPVTSAPLDYSTTTLARPRTNPRARPTSTTGSPIVLQPTAAPTYRVETHTVPIYIATSTGDIPVPTTPQHTPPPSIEEPTTMPTKTVRRPFLPWWGWVISVLVLTAIVVFGMFYFCCGVQVKYPGPGRSLGNRPVIPMAKIPTSPPPSEAGSETDSSEV